MPEDSESPYRPPAAGDCKAAPTCPACGNDLHKGILRTSGTIRWIDDAESELRKFFLGGKPIGKMKSGFGAKYGALHCPECRMFILSDE